MKINVRQLGAQLSRGLVPIYLVAGDEPLLVSEAAATIRAAAREAGFEQRDLHFAERGFKWNDIEAGADNLSLFAARRIVELRLPTPRPGDSGSKALQRLASDPDPDRVILVVTSKLDSAASRSRWVKAIGDAGLVVQVWPIDRAELPRWIERRAASMRLRMSREATEILADRVEGNLLAADQELKKLAILTGELTVDAEQVLASVADSARFDVFLFADAFLGGDARRVFDVLSGLRAEGVQPVLVSWAIARELGLLSRLHAAVQRRRGARARVRQGRRLAAAAGARAPRAGALLRAPAPRAHAPRRRRGSRRQGRATRGCVAGRHAARARGTRSAIRRV